MWKVGHIFNRSARPKLARATRELRPRWKLNVQLNKLSEGTTPGSAKKTHRKNSFRQISFSPPADTVTGTAQSVEEPSSIGTTAEIKSCDLKLHQAKENKGATTYRTTSYLTQSVVLASVICFAGFIFMRSSTVAVRGSNYELGFKQHMRSTGQVVT